MAIIERRYKGWEERAAIITEMEAQGYWMLNDNYDPDWTPVEEPRGVLIWTNEPPPAPQEERR